MRIHATEQQQQQHLHEGKGGGGGVADGGADGAQDDQRGVVGPVVQDLAQHVARARGLLDAQNN